MWINLSKIELLVLELLCQGDLGPGQIAEKLGKKNSFISRALARLEEKGLVERQGRTVRLSPAAHGQGFKKLYDSRPNAKIEDWLCGNAMSILLVLAGSSGGVEFELLEEEAGCSKPTIFKALKQLYAAGVASKTEKAIRITDRFVAEFAENYANAIQNRLLTEVRGHNVSIRVRKHVILRTDAPQVPAFFAKTGLDALVEKGLEASRTSYKDYYFNLDRQKRSPGTEEAFIHALLLTTLQQQQDKPLLAIFLMKNAKKLGMGKLRALAKKYLVEGATEQLDKELDLLRNVADHYQKGQRA